MNLIILAAGRGTRLYPLTKDRPKSLVDLGDGSTLLDRQLENAIHSNVLDKIYVVTGYLSEMIEAKIANYKDRIDVETIYNPFYDVSNNLCSLWCAQHLMLERDFLISNGDNIYKKPVYDIVTENAPEGIQLTIDHKDEYDDDDMKVLLTEHTGVARVSKQIPTDQAQAESVGLVMVKGQSSRQLFHDTLMKMVKEAKHRDSFWLEIFNQMISGGIRINTKLINHDDWGEVDFHPDVEAMRNAIFKSTF